MPESEFANDIRNEFSGNLDASSARKRVEVKRTMVAPIIDGVLDDDVWKTATVISDLHQFQPVDHGQPSEDSIFYISYNDNYFFVGARLNDSEADRIIARQLVQGGGLGSDDSFEFILDTFNNGRTGYHFQVNPNGIRREGIYENPNDLNRDWTGIWQVESRVDEQGWTAEVAIPFTTLNFDPESEEWGFTIARTIARKNEDMAWSSFNRRINPTTTGLVSGIRDIRQGKGLDIIPSVTLARTEEYTSGITDKRFDPSLNVFYKITPNLTGAVTFNTDFSATEVDNRQVNLSRFSLFFPEKRDFFLQDLDIFSFGGLNQNGIPFYSRRIGLSRSGNPVDIDAGVELTGRVGRWNVGGLAVNQGEFDSLDSQNVFVGRAAANVLSESSVGVILTHGDPTSETDNTVAGMDFRYQNTRFSDSHSLRGNFWYQQSDTEGLTGDDKAFGLQASMETQNNGFGGNMNYEYFGDDFNPALGFANRTGVESINFGGSGRYFFRGHKYLRNVFSFMRFGHTRYLDTKEMQSENWFWRMLNFNTNRGDQLGVGGFRNREGLRNDFTIRPGIVIPAGDYTFSGFQMEARLSNQREFAPGFSLNIGDYYNGKRMQINARADWRPNEHINLGLNYNYQDIELPEGAFDVRIISANANYAFNSKWSWINLIQYDNFSNGVGLNSRLRWNPQAGEDLYVVVNYNFDSEGTFSELSSNNSEIVLKYTKNFRF
ncbi:MAG: carbohydrate binding family 9 domain-containing protein [Gammaproteobacteria bacterium]|nr:carbohydrate binding family 9 domain-containing protein [Gammaproteobacteria bacterium]